MSDEAPPPRTSSSSAWKYVAIGCLGATVVLLLAVGGMALLAFRWAKGLERQVSSPVERRDKVLATLGARELPAGYHPLVSVSIPFVLDLAILSDRPVDPAAGEHQKPWDERGFVYLALRFGGHDLQDLRDYVEGRSDDASILERHNIHIKPEQTLRRGAVTLAGGERALYVVLRGSMDSEQGRSEGLLDLVLFDCPDTGRLRTGIWFGPDPEEDDPPGRFDQPGSIGNEADLSTFLGHFRPCGGDAPSAPGGREAEATPVPAGREGEATPVPAGREAEATPVPAGR